MQSLVFQLFIRLLITWGLSTLVWFSTKHENRDFNFGLIHGFGLAVKIQEYEVPSDGLLANLISFNIGVEWSVYGSASSCY